MNPSELHERLLTVGKEKARAAAYYSTKDRYRKQVRAKWIVHHLGSNTLGKSQELAVLEDEYIRACEEAEQAEEAAGVAAVEYEAAKAYFEAWRTMESTKRAEMTLR